jgi:hypothetical protein
MTYEQQLNKVIGMVFSRYRGVEMKREDGYWICLGEKCRTIKDCDAVIDRAGNTLASSIRKTPTQAGA